MRPGRIGIAVGLVVFLTAMGSGVSYALWSTGASTSGTVKAATFGITVDGTAAIAALSVPHMPGESFTSAVTVANTGTADFTYTVAAAPDGGDLAHSSVTIALWKAASSCDTAAVPGDAWTGTLGGLAAHAGEALAATTSQVLCVRTTLLGNVDSGQQGLTASANLIFTATNGWTDSKSVKISPSAYTVPTVVGALNCAQTSDTNLTLTWTAPAGITNFLLVFSPSSASGPVAVTGSTAEITTAPFGKPKQGDGTVTVHSVDATGWWSAGTVADITFPSGSQGNEKIACG